MNTDKFLALLKEQAKQSFIPEFLEESENLTSADEEALGLLVSHLLKWDIDQIPEMMFRATYAAFEDANIHDLCVPFLDMAEHIKEHGTQGLTIEWAISNGR